MLTNYIVIFEKMEKNIFYLIVTLLVGYLFYINYTQPKIAFIKSEILINEFAGMKEAKQIYQQKRQQWQANIDTLRADYQRHQSNNASKEKLAALNQNIQNYSATVEQLSREEDIKKTEAILEQINVFIEKYGEENGYDIILGTTPNGNILYGRDAIDITDELLEALNRAYNPSAYAK